MDTSNTESGNDGRQRRMAKGLAAMLLVLLVLSAVTIGAAAPALAASKADVGKRYGEAKGKYAQDLAKYNAAKDEYKDARDQFLESRESFLKARRLGRGPANETDLLGRAKGYMTTAADYLATMVDHVENQVILANWTNDSLRASWLTKLDGYKANVSSVKSEISDASTKKELVDASKDLKAVWDKVRTDAKMIYGRVLNEQLGSYQGKMSGLSDKLKALIDSAAAKGLNVTSLQSELADLQAKMADARQKYLQAGESYDAGDFDGAKALMKGAHADLKDGSGILKDVNSGLKEALKGTRRQGRAGGNGTADAQ